MKMEAPATPASDGDPDAARLSPAHPWPGLASFAEADRAFFRGRERESDELARLVRREALTILFGRSGLGKTSLIGAGLFPRLREDLHLPVLIRLAHGAAVPMREQVLQALDAACTEVEAEATAPLVGATLWEHFHRVDAGVWSRRNKALTPVLVFDQFEEIFTHGQADDETRHSTEAFISELSDLVEDRPPEALRRALEDDLSLTTQFDFRRRGCKVVLSFREDFLAEMEGLRQRIPSLMRNRYRLLPMNGHQAREVVASGSALVADGVADRIIGLAWRNHAEAPAAEDYERMEVDPALLSVICSELNLRRIAEGSDRIGAELLAGAEREILVDFYLRSLRDLDPRVRVFVEDELITEAGFRDSHAYDDALALPGVTRAAIDQLVAGRLLRVDDRFGVRRLELTHDVLTRVVKDSRDARVAREAEEAAKAREREALAAQKRNKVKNLTSSIVIASALVLFLIAGVSMFRAWNATDRAEKLSLDAVATDLLTNADRAQVLKPDLALLLGTQASLIYPERIDAQLSQLARLIAYHGVRRLLPAQGQVNVSAVSPDGKRGLLGMEDGDIFEIDFANWDVVRHLENAHRGSIRTLAYSPDGTRWASAGGNSVVVWKADDGVPIARVGAWFPGEPGRVRRLTFDRGGRRLAWTYGGKATVWSMADSKTAVQIGETDGRCITFGDDGDTLLYSTEERLEDNGRPSTGIVATRLASGETVQMPRTSGTVLRRSSDCRLAVLRTVNPEGKAGLDLRDAMTGSAVGFLGDAVDDEEEEAEFGPDDRFLTIRQGGTTRVWRTKPFEPLGSVNHDEEIVASAVSPDGRWLAIGMRSGEALVQSIADNVTVVNSQERPAQVTAFLFSPDGKSMASFKPTWQSHQTVHKVWSLEQGPVLASAGKVHRAEEIEFNSAGTVLGTSMYSANFWNASDGRLLKADEDLVLAEFSPDGTRVAIERPGGKVDVVDVLTVGKPILTLPAPADASHKVRHFAISRDNKLLGVAATDGSIWLREIRQDGATTTLPSAPGTNAIAFSPDDKTLAVGGDKGSVQLYRLGAKTTVDVLPKVQEGESRRGAENDGEAERRAVGQGVLKLTFSPDGKQIVLGRKDGLTVVQNIADGQVVATFGPRETGGDPNVARKDNSKDRRTGDQGGDRDSDWVANRAADLVVDRLVFIEGGDALVSGNSKGGREVWDLRKRWQLARLSDLGGRVKSVDISPAGRRVAILQYDASVSIQNWDQQNMLEDACRIAGRNLTCGEWRQYLHDAKYHLICPASPPPEDSCQ